MSFTALQFWVFAASVFAIYWLVRSKRWQNSILLLASYIFYGWIQPWLSIMLGVSTLVDYFLSLGIKRFTEHKRYLMTTSVILNLGVLAFFKYYNFFSDDLVSISTALGVSNDLFLTKIW